MRNIYSILVVILIATNVFAQSPQKMSYQGVIHNANNNLVKNQSIGMKISILSGTTNGTAVYVETQTPTTNDNGLITIEIGGGVIQTGTFAGINWANGTYFIKTETDPAGGTNYSITGTSQLLSVPYAQHAKTAESISGYAISQQIPIVETMAASNIEGSLSTLNGKVNGNGFNTTVNFEWGLTAEYGNSLSAIPSSINGSNDVNVAANITGLQSNTTYHYRINATNAINTTKSSDQTFKTLIIAPVLTTKPIISIGSIYSTSGGNVISDGGWAITSKGVCWSTISNPTISDNKTIDGNGIGEFSSSISGLLPNTTYFVKAYATNSSGTFYGNEISFKTTFTMAIGDLYLGGKIAYLDVSGVHGFVCALTDQSRSVKWYAGNNTTGATNTELETIGVYGISKSGGRKNTDAIILAQGAGTYAASICAALTTGGATAGDWYMPSKGELNQLYINRNNLGGFEANYYWSSSESTYVYLHNPNAWYQAFSNGNQSTYGKDNGYQVRAIRAF